ncbi:MAG: polysaccharide deacetylase family protein [Bacteroidota bacterium]
MKKTILLFGISLLLLNSCNKATEKNQTKPKEATPSALEKVEEKPLVTNTPAEILAKKQVPILCYHRIKDLRPGDGPMTKTYTVTPTGFAAQMKILSDNGYHSILPNDLYDYLLHNKPLPKNPVMITFDDTQQEQYTIGAPEMEKYGFKGVFFVMTVSINRPNYMTKTQIKELSDKGNCIASHTWDHHMVTKYTDADWVTQIEKPKMKLEKITGKTITDFAYPFGLWNSKALPEIKKRGFKMAFALTSKRDSILPEYTIRRIIVPSQWTAERMIKAMNDSFK